MISIKRKPSVDWFRILSDLRRAGMSQCAVARVLGVPRNRVKHWAVGKLPRYDDGRALLYLWRRACFRKLSPNGQGRGVQSEHGSATLTGTPATDGAQCFAD